MFLTKPTSELTYKDEDIEALISSGEPESIMLDHKMMLSGSERDRAELTKDTCAFDTETRPKLQLGFRIGGG
jgi:hypothetical protein